MQFGSNWRYGKILFWGSQNKIFSMLHLEKKKLKKKGILFRTAITERMGTAEPRPEPLIDHLSPESAWEHR